MELAPSTLLTRLTFDPPKFLTNLCYCLYGSHILLFRISATIVFLVANPALFFSRKLCDLVFVSIFFTGMHRQLYYLFMK